MWRMFTTVLRPKILRSLGWCAAVGPIFLLTQAKMKLDNSARFYIIAASFAASKTQWRTSRSDP